jgi:hypothetical protein
MEKEVIQNNNTAIPQSQETSHSPGQIPGTPKQKHWLIFGLLILIFILVGTTIFFYYQNFQLVRQKANKLQPAISLVSPSPAVTNPTSKPTKPTSIYPNIFNYKNFSIGYPNNWIILDMSKDENFPIKERLSPVYPTAKVIALSKEGVYLIIAIETEREGGAGGIFVDNKHYDEFVTNRDKVSIVSSTFYLSKTHYAISSLLESHGGPYTWSCLAEYLPNKTTQSGKVFKGYEDVITKNGFDYNFIIVSENEGLTSPELQSEIISILQSIDW